MSLSLFAGLACFILAILLANVLVAVHAATIAARTTDVQTRTDVILTVAGAYPVQVIRVIREMTGLGLKEAKSLVDDVPSVIPGGSLNVDALTAIARLEAAGASATRTHIGACYRSRGRDAIIS